MITQKFRRSNLYIIAVIPVIAVLLWVKALMVVKLPYLNSIAFQNMTLFQPINDLIYHFKIEKVMQYFALVLFVFQGFFILQLNKHKIIRVKSFLPVLLFIFIAGSFIHIQRIHPIYIGNIFFIKAIDRILMSQKKKQAIANYFDASLLLAIASLFYINYIFFILVIWFSLIILRPFRWREWLVTIVGFFIPFVLSWAYEYLMSGIPKSFFYTVVLHFAPFEDFSKFLNDAHYIFYIFLGVLIIFSSGHILSIYKFRKINVRNSLLVFLFIFVVSGILFILLPTASMEMLFIGGIPIAYVLSGFLLSLKRQWFSDIVLIIMAGMLFYIQYLTII